MRRLQTRQHNDHGSKLSADGGTCVLDFAADETSRGVPRSRSWLSASSSGRSAHPTTNKATRTCPNAERVFATGSGDVRPASNRTSARVSEIVPLQLVSAPKLPFFERFESRCGEVNSPPLSKRQLSSHPIRALPQPRSFANTKTHQSPTARPQQPSTPSST